MNREHWDAFVADLSFDIYQAAMQDTDDTDTEEGETTEDEREEQVNEAR